MWTLLSCPCVCDCARVVIWKTVRAREHNKTGWWSMAGQPAKQSADKSQDEFLMQSPWGCWMLQRRHWVIFCFFFSVAHPFTPNQFLMFLKHSFLLQLLSVLCWSKEMWRFFQTPPRKRVCLRHAWVAICFSGFYYEIILACVVTFSVNRSLFLL